MVTWTKDAIENLLARQRSQRDQARPGGNRPMPGDTYSLPKAGFPQTSVQERAASTANNFRDRLRTISNTYDFEPDGRPSPYLESAEDLIFKANKVSDRIAKRLSNPVVKQIPYEYDVMVNAPYGVPVAGGRKPPKTNRPFGNLVDPQIVKQSGGQFNAFANAIAGKESGGNYGAVNPSSGALGKYQIMPSNIAGPGGWDKEILGRNITPQQFLASPRLQEQIAMGKLRQYYNQYGPGGAAAAWYGGPGAADSWKSNTGGQGAYPSVRNYVLAILKAMGM